MMLGMSSDVGCQGVFSNLIALSLSLQEFFTNTTPGCNAEKRKWCICDIPFNAVCDMWGSKNSLQL